MNPSRGLKPPHPLVVFLVVFSASLVFYCFLNRAELNGRSELHKDQSNSEVKKLGRVLKRASMPDRSVIVTILSQEWASPGSVFDLFLESFRVGQGTKFLLNHLVVFTADGQAFQYCKSSHPLCFDIATYGINYATWKAFKYVPHLKLGWRKVQLLDEVIGLGYNILFTDVDVMWFRNPFPYLDPNQEMNAAIDIQQGTSKSTNADGGFFYLKCNGKSAEFLKYWKMMRFLRPNRSDQFIFQRIKDDPIGRSLLRIVYLDTDYFGSFCESNNDLNKLRTMHAKCYDSTERKVHYLRLALDVWKNFTAPTLLA